MATRKATGRLGASSPTIKKLAQGYARAALSGYRRNRDGGLDYMGTEGKRLGVWEKRIAVMSGPTQKLVERQATKLFNDGIDRLSRITRDKSGKVVTSPRATTVRRKPNTAGRTGTKSKGGGKLRSDAQLVKEFDALYGKAKSLPKGSKARATAQREMTKRMVAYNRKAKADGTAGSYTPKKLGSKTARELSRLADKLYAEARATTGKKAKAALGRKALAVMKAYNAKMRASGKGGERYDLTLNRQRTGVSDG